MCENISSSSSPFPSEIQAVDQNTDILCMLLLNQANLENRLLHLESRYAGLEEQYKSLQGELLASEVRYKELEGLYAEHRKSVGETEREGKEENSPLSLPLPVPMEKKRSIYDDSFVLYRFPAVTYTWCNDYKLFPSWGDVHELDSYGNNILTRSNCPDLTAFALQSGVDVHHVNKGGLSVMHFLYRVPLALDLLLQAGGNINVRDTQKGQTPLFLCKSVKLCIRMQAAGALLSVRDKKGNTLLHSAKSKALYNYYLTQGLFPIANLAGKLPNQKWNC
jgi:hypothetical protein